MSLIAFQWTEPTFESTDIVNFIPIKADLDINSNIEGR